MERIEALNAPEDEARHIVARHSVETAWPADSPPQRVHRSAVLALQGSIHQTITLLSAKDACQEHSRTPQQQPTARTALMVITPVTPMRQRAHLRLRGMSSTH